MEIDLSSVTTEELRKELKKRRKEEAEAIVEKRAQKAAIPRCRNCKFFISEKDEKTSWKMFYRCTKQTYICKGKIKYHIANPSRKGCEIWERGEG